MRIVFRTDASVRIGTGHVMRSLTLADALRERGAQCLFVCRQHRGHLLDWIAQRGHEAIALPGLIEYFEPPTAPAHAPWLETSWSKDAAQTSQVLSQHPADWLVVDHYALDHCWERTLRPFCHRLMVIDDLADRPHECDILLDQNLGRSAQDYSALLPTNTTSLVGPRYALLRPEFSQWREYSLVRRAHPRINALLITMGGVDKNDATGTVLDLLAASGPSADLNITVVMGSHAPWLAKVQEKAKKMPCRTQVLVGVNNMAQLMAESDLAIGASGSTSWERCCLGLPTVQLVLAENQKAIAEALSRGGAAISTNFDTLPQALATLLNGEDSAAILTRMIRSAIHLIDGRGAERVSEFLK